MNFNEHIGDAELEAYIMHKLPEEDIDRLEEHTLICDRCRRQLEQTETFILSMRAAALNIRQDERVSQPTSLPWWQRALRPVMARPGLAVAGVAVIATLLFLPLRPDTPLAYHELYLRSLRGVETETAPSGKHVRLRLRLDITGLPSPDLYKAAVFDSAGRSLWETSISRSSSSLEVVVSVIRGLPSGLYWVRLSDALTGKLLREYQLRVG
ncbi:MAG TPA: zf-HC2 domain-containing protein [Bryobacteraceae bacterium]|nr:zf-HC2 domain-containing protein [Bryobacteraceae bacterium]